MTRLADVESALLSGRYADVVAVHRVPARAGRFAEWPESLDPRVALAVRTTVGIERPYAHQRAAIDAVRGGRDVVLATSTASGKSLCYQVPVLEAALQDPRSRCLMLFPTKALARDQVRGLRALASGCALGVGLYDGDTPPDERRAARTRAHVVATNPEMLHRGLLPHHERWGEFLANLRHIVIDELHTYRGLFGSHLANVLRRLWRVCRYHGSSPTVVACSATIANPRGLAETLCGPGRQRGRPAQDSGFVLIDRERETAPVGPRTFVILNPKVVDPLTGVRRSYVKVTRRVTAALARADVATLAFCRTRKTVELLTRYLREDAAKFPVTEIVDGDALDRAAKAVRGYRGGYLPERRREVEKALKSGEARVVATTNALELGVDIGGLDAVVLAGYPGTRAATVQRSGRAGRRTEPSLTVLVLSSDPIDQFIANAPGFLFDRPPEHARLDPDNPEVLIPHLRCAAHELPILGGQSFFGDAPDSDSDESYGDDEPLSAAELDPALEYLADAGTLHRQVDGRGNIRYLAVGDRFPADKVDLRGPLEENFSVVLEAPGCTRHGTVVAEVDFEDAPLYLHPGAIYAIEGVTHEVDRLDWNARKAFVREVAADYYTEAVCKRKVRIVEPILGSTGDTTADVSNGGHFGVGYAHLVRTVPGFKKLRFRTHENIGFGPVALPDLELHTVAAHWSVGAQTAVHLADPGARVAAALAAARAIHHGAAMLLMCDVGDLGSAVSTGPGVSGAAGWASIVPTRGRVNAELAMQASATPCIYLYDKVPGGAGFARQACVLGPALFDHVLQLVEGCGCRGGCPTCTGPSQDVGMVGTTTRIADPGRGHAAAALQPRGSSGSLRRDVVALLRGLRELVA